MLFNKVPYAFSQIGGEPWIFRMRRSTFSHIQDQATSWLVSHSLGRRDRSDANIQDLYSAKLTCLLPTTFAILNARTSHSSCKRAELATFVTMLSKHAKTSFIQSAVVPVPKPITAELNLNISGYVVGTS